jgi:imidazole glycerol-phosphate synthase subunit HisH
VLFTGIAEGTRFYFVHSFALRMRDAGPLLADGAKITVTEHGEPFAAAVEYGRGERGVVAATQFHPEKSGDAGATVLSNWLAGL